MTQSSTAKPHTLSAAQIEQNFADAHPPLSRSEALIEADRCYFCYDAPCTTACPTDIDIPGFIQQIRSDNIEGSAFTILRENIMGGMCARVCPTEVLCEEVCVRQTHEDQPVRIGLLQRYATDPVLESGTQLFSRAAETGFKIAVVGGGPAGLSCAHRSARQGHAVTVFNAQDKLGGLNEYGIAAYKTVDNFAQREADYILSIGGIEVKNSMALGRDFTLAQLQQQYDAVFLAMGLAGANELGLDGDQDQGVVDAVEYIARLRQTDDKSSLPVGRNVVVIGGGMTAIDIATQSRLLGAEMVTICYRRGPEQMGASYHEQVFAQERGVLIRHWLQPCELVRENGTLTGVQFEYTQTSSSGRLQGTGEFCTVDADVVFKAIGQKISWSSLGSLDQEVTVERGRIQVDERRRTSLTGVWAGGDCVADGLDLTVSAVQDGKIAAGDIDQYLRSKQREAEDHG